MRRLQLIELLGRGGQRPWRREQRSKMAANTCTPGWVADHPHTEVEGQRRAALRRVGEEHSCSPVGHMNGTVKSSGPGASKGGRANKGPFHQIKQHAPYPRQLRPDDPKCACMGCHLST